MTKAQNKVATPRKRKQKVEDLIDQNAENASSIEQPAEFHNQLGNWNAQDAVGETDVTLSDADLETIEAIAESTEDAKPEPAKAVQNEPAAETVETADDSEFGKLIATFSDEAVEKKVFEIADCVEARETFEDTKDSENKSIKRTLKNVRSAFVTKYAARAMLATKTDPAFINRSLHDGSRYNVYALGKAADLMKGMTNGAVSNAINIACMKTLFKFRDAGVQFTGEIAKACASDKIRISDTNLKKHLVRHTVSASTAPTQASSTMQAMETLGLVKRSGTAKSPIYELTDHPAVAKLEAQLMAA